VNPGDTVRAYLTFMSPEMHVGRICAGTIFLLREGHKTVGYSRVTQVLELEQSAQRIREEASRP
jgi:translation elongation factor EF-Tu-like GTPase